jgi:hypothetical protein
MTHAGYSFALVGFIQNKEVEFTCPTVSIGISPPSLRTNDIKTTGDSEIKPTQNK